MEFDILKQEEEFHKENAKLEMRTKELLQKVDDVMKIQDNLIKETFKTKTDISCAKNICKYGSNLKFSNNGCGDVIKNSEINDINVPHTVQEMGTKGASHFYRAKIKALEMENERLQTQNKAKNEEIKKLQKVNQNLVDDKEKWFLSYNTAKTTIAKLEAQISSLSSKIQASSGENISLKKELEQVKKESKTYGTNLHNCEVRLNRANEEIDKLKTALKNCKDEEKEQRDSYRKQIHDLSTHAKQIEKHKTELLNGFKKQLLLIDNLKKQKMNLQALKYAELSETEFMKLLDLKME